MGLFLCKYFIELDWIDFNKSTFWSSIKKKLNCGERHKTKFTIVEWLKWPFSGIEHIHALCRLCHRLSRGLFSSCKTGTWRLLKSNSHSSCPGYWQPPSTFCLYEFDYSSYLIQYLVFCAWLIVTEHNVLKFSPCYSMYQNVSFLKSE